MLYFFIDCFAAAVVPALAVLLIFGVFKKTSAKKLIPLLLFTIYFAVMLDVVGIIDVSISSWRPEISFIPFGDLFEQGFSLRVAAQYILNLIMFIPFGFLLPMIWRGFRRLLPTGIAGLAASLFIEMSQLFNMRLTAVDDIIMNTLGAIAGYLIIAGFAKKTWERTGETAVRTGAGDVMELLIVALVTFACALFIKYPIGKLIYGLPVFS